MSRRGRAASAVAAVCTALVAAAWAPDARAVTTAPQVRHLVYSFTWGTSNDTEVQTSGIAMTGNSMGMNGGGGSGSGTVSSTGGTSDHGTIVVDVVRRQPDNGVVVNVSEQATGRRNAPVAECVAYGDLTVVCDPNKKINAEELTLLRFFGATFVDPAELDAKRHWQRAQGGAISDFTIATSTNGIMTINESGVTRTGGARPDASNVVGSIVYDFNRTIPTSVHEQTTSRSEQGEQYQTVTSETVLQLVSDSSVAQH